MKIVKMKIVVRTKDINWQMTVRCVIGMSLGLALLNKYIQYYIQIQSTGDTDVNGLTMYKIL